MFLVKAYTIAHLAFGGWGLWVQALAEESVPDLGHGVGGDLMRGHPNTPMIGVIVRMDQWL